MVIGFVRRFVGWSVPLSVSPEEEEASDDRLVVLVSAVTIIGKELFRYFRR